MKIAVTGGTGFIGHYILREILSQGHSAKAWYRSAPSADPALQGESVEWIQGEFGNSDSVTNLLDGVDAVIHGALYRPGAGFRGAEGDLIDFAEKNIIGSLQIFEEAKRLGGLPTVFLSTCAVHEKILEDRALDEAHPLWATSHYGSHKAAIEKFIHSYGLGDGMPFCALRPTGVYGVHHQRERSKWYSLVSALKNNESVTCERGGKEVHAQDVAKAALLLLQTDGIAGEAYNCYDRYVSEWDVAQLVKEITGSDAEINGEQRRPKHQIETGKLRALGFEFGGDSLLSTTITELCS